MHILISYLYRINSITLRSFEHTIYGQTRTMRAELRFALVVSLTLATTNGIEYQGILMNGVEGTQLYDPFNEPHARGNLALGLLTADDAVGAAVINGHLAYFLGGIIGGVSKIIVLIRQYLIVYYCR